jgi:periplasmic protein TonB
MSEWAHSMGRDNRLRIQAWSYSLALHVMIVVLAMVFSARLTLTRQDEPFRWNVAMVEPVSTHDSAQPSPPVDVPATPTHSKPSAQSMTASKPVVQQKTKPMPVERHVETISPPVRQQVEAAPQETILERIERPVQTVEPSQPMERPAETRPSVEAPPLVAAHSTTAPAIIERPTPAAESTPAPIERAVETAHIIQPTEQTAQPAEPVHQPAPSIEKAVPMVTERETAAPVEQSAQLVQRQPADTAPVTQQPEAASTASRPADPSMTDRPAVQEERTVVAKADPAATPSPRPDYGWVRDALRRRIVEMKQYPAQARLNHLEGKVILRAVIRADGHLGDLSVKESSGHRVLDDAAMEVIRRICPVPLKHVLGKPEIVVMIPIDYRLE